ncbi:MAG: cation-translocating P-type ATPase [Bacteroidetes bacterium]|nr:MAG: cation-translocating P-type ATPase [Bacteroidota bacterium]
MKHHAPPTQPVAAAPSTAWHILSTEAVMKRLNAGPEGLPPGEQAQRRMLYGPNELPGKKPKSAWLMFLAQFQDLMIVILLVAAIVSGFLGDLKDTIVIMVIVVLNAVIGFVQEFRAEKALESLKKLAAPTATVLRGGEKQLIPARELVPGDVVLLEAGNMVPADLRLLEAHTLKMDEASLTGESVTVQKQTAPLPEADLPAGDRTNMAFKGTLVTYGRGKGVVVATGQHTEIGQIAQMLQQAESTTPLQKRLADFGKKLSLIVLAICVLIFGTGVLRGGEMLEMLLTAISVAVAAIPEALPAVVTISLALGARRLLRQQALIRKLPAVETLGSVTFICTDKTGTLTQNRMQLTHIWTPPQPPAGLPFTPRQILLLCMSLNHDAEKNPQGEWLGDPTEVALADYADKHTDLQAINPIHFPRVAELPFDADRKLMTTVHAWNGQYLIVTKGAAEAVMEVSDHPPEQLIQEAERLAQQGLRTLAYACKLMEKLPSQLTFSTLESQLQVVGLAGMMDPPREEVPRAIAACKTAGIVPVMITGDHPVTAAAIAQKIGIMATASDLLVTGRELKEMPEKTFAQQVERIKVYARVSPRQKLDIVDMLQRKKQFVAMTGDGVNDAPALKKANIGVAMGITGTDVAKEAAHIVLLDDNFATIVKAVKEGRRIFDNIRKFIKYTMTSNSGEIWTIFLAPLLGLPIPLLPIHILWINLVTDGLPGLALAGEPPEKNLMKRPPRKPGEGIFAHGLGLHIFWVGLLMGAVCLGTQAWSLQAGDPKWQTYVFTILCFSQMGHVLAIRSEYFFLFRQGIFTNMPLIGAVLITVVLQLLILYVPLLNDIFSVQPLSWQELGVCLLLSSVVFHAVEMEKFLRSWRKRPTG